MLTQAERQAEFQRDKVRARRMIKLAKEIDPKPFDYSVKMGELERYERRFAASRIAHNRLEGYSDDFLLPRYGWMA